MLALLGVYMRLNIECLLRTSLQEGPVIIPANEITSEVVLLKDFIICAVTQEDNFKFFLTSSLCVTGRMVSMSSVLGGLPRSWLWLWDERGGGFPSSLRTWRSPFAVAPALSFRTGFVSHFFNVLTERLDPGELGAELPDACGGSDTTEVEMLPSLPAAEYESGEGETKGEESSEIMGL